MASENQNLSESVEELKLKLEAMKKLIDEENEEKAWSRRRSRTCNESLINGNFMSFIFIMVLVTIICVAIYAFSSLFFAIRKKYPGIRNPEL